VRLGRNRRGHKREREQEKAGNGDFFHAGTKWGETNLRASGVAQCARVDSGGPR
jgi:hypothetical protein